MPQPPLRPMSVGEVLDVGFGVYRRHLATLVTLTVLLTGLPLVVFGAGAALVTPSLAGDYVTLILLALLFIIGYVVLSQLAMGACVLVIAEGYLGRDLSAGDAVRRTVGRLGLLLVAGLLVGLVAGLGMLLIIVPGIIFICGLIITTQVVMLEAPTGAGAAMSRAWSLSRGFKGRIFLLLLVSIVLSAVVLMGTNILVTLLMGGVSALTADPGAPPSMPMVLAQQGVQLVMNMLIAPLMYCFLTVAYYDLRVRKEAFDLEILANSLSA